MAKEEHRQAMLAFLERDIAHARRLPFVLGFKIWSRGAKWPCPRAATFEGAYLVEELPELYPADCPVGGPQDACCCVMREFVFRDDNSPEAAALLARTAARNRRERTMALIKCWECGKEISDSALACPHCGAARKHAPAEAVRQPVAPTPKSRSNWLLWVIGVPIGLFLLMMVVGANVSPEKAARYARERSIEEACDQMMADSALGTERRMTRQVCDNMKAAAKMERSSPPLATTPEIEAALADGRARASEWARQEPTPLPKPPDNLFTGYPQAPASSR